MNTHSQLLASRQHDNEKNPGNGIEVDHVSLGCALEAEGDLEGAKLCFRRAIEIDQENSYAHFLLGCILEDEGEDKGDIADLRGAERCFRKMIEIDPEDGIAYNRLGCVLESIGSALEAEGDLAHTPRRRLLT
jgi:Flp pilus assembly protein TadD